MRNSKLLPTLAFLLSLFFMSCGGSETSNSAADGAANTEAAADVEAIEAEAEELESIDTEIEENAAALEKALDALNQ